MTSPGRPNFGTIAITSILMAAGVFVVGHALRAGQEGARIPAAPVAIEPIFTEAGVFERSAKGAALKDLKPEPGKPERRLAGFYSRRAYPGGPPVIPHKLFDEKSIGGKSCLACHLDGGWMPMFNAYTPVTPHPELANCRSCHVTGENKTTFRSTQFTPAQPVALPKGALPGAPPPIPHDLEMRSNCLACHAGPAAAAEIRTTHPERANCRQCHALGARPVPAFTRPPAYHPAATGTNAANRPGAAQ
jgi:nitrate reductase (cytochrome), electron transfer subunit